MVRYLHNHQNADGGYGLHIEVRSSAAPARVEGSRAGVHRSLLASALPPKPASQPAFFTLLAHPRRASPACMPAGPPSLLCPPSPLPATCLQGTSTMFGTALSYVTLRLLGVGPDAAGMAEAREWVSGAQQGAGWRAT